MTEPQMHGFTQIPAYEFLCETQFLQILSLCNKK